MYFKFSSLFLVLFFGLTFLVSGCSSDTADAAEGEKNASLSENKKSTSNEKATDTDTEEGETGTPEVPKSRYIEIDTVRELKDISDDLDGNYRLTADIDLTGSSWTPIGTSSDPFTGRFDGREFSIKGLRVIGSKSNVGLFGVVDDASISDLSLSFVSVNGSSNVGALAGKVNDSSIRNVAIRFGVVNGSNSVGGLIGEMNDSSIRSVYSFVDVNGVSTSSSNVGGLIGEANNSEIAESLSSGVITGNGTFISGMIGELTSSNLSRVVSYGNLVSSSSVVSVGGLTGSNNTGNKCSEAFFDESLSDHNYADDTNLCGEAKASTILKEQTSNAGPYANWNTETWDFGTVSEYPSLSFISEFSNSDDFDNVVGLGISSDPFIISSSTNFLFFSDKTPFFLNKHYELSGDIDLTDVEWTPIGTEANPFVGSFDGNGHTISNLEIDDSTTSIGVGLFGMINNSTISNLSLADFNITGNRVVGALVGGASNSTISSITLSGSNSILGTSLVGGLIGAGESNSNISNCSSSGSVSTPTDSSSSDGSAIGGLVGFIEDSDVSNCSSSASVNGSSYRVGGLIGLTHDSNISNSFSSGIVVSSDKYTGGFVGEVSDSNISNSFSSGNVTGTNDVGGFVGYANDFNISNSFSSSDVEGSGDDIGGFIGEGFKSEGDDVKAIVSNSFSYGNVTSAEDSSGVGGFMGSFNHDSASDGLISCSNSYWDTTTSDETSSASDCIAVDKTTSELQVVKNSTNLYKDWSDSVWTFAAGSYPILTVFNS